MSRSKSPSHQLSSLQAHRLLCTQSWNLHLLYSNHSRQSFLQSKIHQHLRCHPCERRYMFVCIDSDCHFDVPFFSFLSLRLFRQSIPKLARGGDSKLPSRMYFAIALFATLISLFTANWRPLSVAQCPSWSCPALSILWTNPNLAAFSTLPTGAHTPLL